MLNKVKSLAGNIKYGAKVLSWLADSLAAFPELPNTEKEADKGSQRSERFPERIVENVEGDSVPK